MTAVDGTMNPGSALTPAPALETRLTDLETRLTLLTDLYDAAITRLEAIESRGPCTCSRAGNGDRPVHDHPR